MKCIGTRLMLCEFNYTHISSYLYAFTDEVIKQLHISDKRAEYLYLLHRLPLVNMRKTFFFIIVHKRAQSLMGAIEIRGEEYAGQLYCWLHPKHWGHNYLQEAMELASRIYFSCTNALYFTARVDIDNIRSYKALKKCGFADYRRIEGPNGQQYELLLRKK